MARSKSRWITGVIGLVLLAIGAVRVVITSSASGTVVLVVTGAVLALSPLVVDRIERVSVSATSFDLHLTREVSDLGAPNTAQILQRTNLASFAESYAFIREELDDNRFYDVRVYLQDLLVERSAAIGRRESFDAREVRRLFLSGSPVLRVLVLGLMEGNPALADARTVLAAVAQPVSSNEQYHGLLLAESCWNRFAKTDRKAIHEAIRASGIPATSDRRTLADEVLALSPDLESS